MDVTYYVALPFVAADDSVAAGEAVLQLDLHLAKMTRADPMRQRAQGRTAIPRLAPSADRDAQRELSLTRCTRGPVAARMFQTKHAP